MNYKSVIVTARGGLEAVEIAEQPLGQPAGGQARIKVQASAVVQDDIAIRRGNRPFLRQPPFVPGYSFIGRVDAVGPGVINVTVGDRVTALTQFNSHAEYILWDAAELVAVPEALDAVKAAPLILNYLVAYQTLHRVAQVKAGDTILIVGASGGVGPAYLELGRLAGLKMYGLASAAKHEVLRQYGAIPIDYRTEDFVQVIGAAEPQGVDYVFNGMAQDYLARGLAVLKKGGVLVHYGGPQSFGGFLKLVARLLWTNLLPNGKKIAGYGTHRLGTELFRPDWTHLFALVAEGKIDPIIAATFPLTEAREAYGLLESGRVVGNIVLLAPEIS